MSAHGDDKAVEEAKKRFAEYVKDKATLSSDLTGVVFKTVMRHGDEVPFTTEESALYIL